MAVLPGVTVGANEGAYQNNVVNAKAIAAATTDTLLISGIRDQRSLVVVVNISTFSAGTLTVTILGNPLSPSAATYTMLASAALGAAAVTTLQVGPGLPATSNVSANVVLGPQVQLSLVYASSPSFTYSLDIILGY